MHLRLMLVAVLLCGMLRSTSAQPQRVLSISDTIDQPAEIAAKRPGDCARGRCDLAALENPDGARNSAAGFIFTSDKPVPAPIKPIHFWIWPSTLSQSDLDKAVTQVRASRVDTVADPAEESWTHVLLWNSNSWILERAGATDGDELGWTLTAAALKARVPPGARVWVNLPPSQELGGKLALREKKQHGTGGQQPRSR
jgi:hypothetical protein